MGLFCFLNQPQYKHLWCLYQIQFTLAYHLWLRYSWPSSSAMEITDFRWLNTYYYGYPLSFCRWISRRVNDFLFSVSLFPEIYEDFVWANRFLWATFLWVTMKPGWKAFLIVTQHWTLQCEVTIFLFENYVNFLSNHLFYSVFASKTHKIIGTLLCIVWFRQIFKSPSIVSCFFILFLERLKTADQQL